MRKLEELLEKVGRGSMSDIEREEQRRSFAFGNTKTENDRMTRVTINKAAERKV